MAAKLYVGNIPFSATKEQLVEMFSQAGTVVDATIIIDKMSGRSKGFAFVEMSSEEEAKKAVEMFNDQDMDGRKIRVDEARPPKERNFNQR